MQYFFWLIVIVLLMSEKNKIHRKLVIEGIIAVFIALTPLIFYYYKYLPDETDSVSILGFTVKSNGFADASTTIYYLGTKFVPLCLLIIWFVTNKNWWYHAILIPIAMYSFQIYSILQQATSDGIVDENEILYVVGITMVIAPVVYLIRLKLVDKYVHGIDLKAMDTELRILKEKQELEKEREKLERQKEALAKKM